MEEPREFWIVEGQMVVGLQVIGKHYSVVEFPTPEGLAMFETMGNKVIKVREILPPKAEGVSVE